MIGEQSEEVAFAKRDFQACWCINMLHVLRGRKHCMRLVIQKNNETEEHRGPQKHQKMHVDALVTVPVLLQS